MPAPPTSANDLRLDTLTAWLAGVLGTREFRVAPASADASFRRYFRVVPVRRGKGAPR